MKLLVFSDSHGYLDGMEAAIRREKPDMVLHLGDHCRDVDALRQKFPAIPMDNVAGNCDFGVSLPDTKTLNISGVRFFLTHGHRYYVKSMYLRVLYGAQEQEAQVLLFGHTHRPELFREGEMWVMNPGSAGKRGTYGVIHLEEGGIDCALHSLV